MAEVVEKARPSDEKYAALVVENELARYAEPSNPSKVPDQLPEVSSVSAPAVLVKPAPVRSVKYSELIPITGEYRVVEVAFPTSVLPDKVVEASEAEDVALKDPSVRPLYRVDPVGAKLPTPPILSIDPADVVPIPTKFEKYDLPDTSKMLASVAVALEPIMITSDVSVG